MSFTGLPVATVVGALAIVASMPAGAFAQSNASVPAPEAAPKVAVPVPQPPAPYRWTGVYFGGFVGGAWSKSDVTTTVASSPTGYFAQSSVDSINAQGAQTLRPNAIVYGGEAGYDFQVARLVFGGSFDFSVMTMNDFVVSGTTYPCCPASSYALTQTIETNWLMTARARVGWAAGSRLLLFGTAGIAWMDLKYKAQFSDSFAAATESADADEIVSGWVYGGGAEYRLSRHVSVKGEYLLGDFDGITTTSTNLKSTGGTWPTSVFTHTADMDLNVVKGSVKVRW